MPEAMRAARGPVEQELIGYLKILWCSDDWPVQARIDCRALVMSALDESFELGRVSGSLGAPAIAAGSAKESCEGQSK